MALTVLQGQDVLVVELQGAGAKLDLLRQVISQPRPLLPTSPADTRVCGEKRVTGERD